MTVTERDEKCWFVMRDLKRPNSKSPAYKRISEQNIEVFTPLQWRTTTRNGVAKRELVPYIHDLLFVHEVREVVDRVVETTPKLQYRYVRGGGYCQPMVVDDEEMERFIAAVEASNDPVYYSPEEIEPQMIGRKVRITGGVLDGYEGNLLRVSGSSVKRLMVSVKDLFTVGVEVDSDSVDLL